MALLQYFIVFQHSSKNLVKRRYHRRFFTSLSVVTRLRYEQRSRKAERGPLAVASATKQKIVLYVRLLAPAQTLFASVLGRSWSEQDLRSKRQ